jgi:dephospho-CoA kinase
MLRIGITGPIGCGKSQIARWLGERPRVVVIDADHEARLVLGPGTAEVEAVYTRFGAGLRRSDGELDRAALGRLVFADPVALADLESIVHPAVRPRILAAIEGAGKGAAEAVIIEAIKLVEGGLADLCDEVWLVTCDPAVQLERLVGRGSESTDATARIQAQGDLVARLRPWATWVVDTSGPRAATRRLVEARFTEALTAHRPA